MIALEKLNTVIAYIEAHISEEINLQQLADLALCSLYDFQRSFAFVAEMSVADYIKKRRLTLAGLALQDGMKVVDAALQYGYDSPTSFARAFQALHGITPRDAKQPNASLNLFPRIAFQAFIKEVNDVKIVETEELFLSGFLVKADSKNPWKRYETQTKRHAQPELVDWTGYEVRFYPPKGEQIFTACRQKERVNSPHYELLVVPAATWAVFDIDHKIDQAPQYAEVDQWLHENKSRYTQMQWDADGRLAQAEFVLCQYDHQGKFGSERIMELWVPLEKTE